MELLGHPPHLASSAGLVSLNHYEGMWIAFTVTAALTAALVLKLSQSVAANAAEAVSMRERALRSERLAMVTTLAAGAAHELGSPLGTIAVAASELARKLDATPGSPPALSEDARLIRSEVDRCRAVLDRLASEGGEITGEGLVSVHVDDLLSEVVSALTPAEAARTSVRHVGEEELGRLLLPRRAVVQSLRDLIRNGLDASPAGAGVALSATEAPGRIVLTIEDRGKGMPPELLARVGEPFFSTKPPGRGLGLGLFLARGLCDRLGWLMEIESQPGAGSRITIAIPRTESKT
jgi:two-component system sensor histidine kinase RegB